MSADPEPMPTHVPRHGSLLAAPDDTLRAVREYAVRGAKHVWERMQVADDTIPLGHDGYLKLWALSQPMIAADFILMDEAQDTNPVVLDVLLAQPAQMIYVGDKYQQIYEWRGAVNAMEAINTENESFLTTSFRFGDAIAEGATKVLALLGEGRPLRGNPGVASRIAPTPLASTVLARTNAYAITALIEAIDAGKRPHLIGGTEELMKMLRGVSDLKRGEPSDVPDFFGFGTWQEVIEFARSGEGEHLQTFVNLIETRGERQLMWALGRVVDADASDLVVSTAHKAKGREWPTVRLMDDFIKSQPRRRREEDAAGKRPLYDPSELRLLYVALTRAKV
jgi:superfamily I DNA/RNA helicase